MVLNKKESLVKPPDFLFYLILHDIQAFGEISKSSRQSKPEKLTAATYVT